MDNLQKVVARAVECPKSQTLVVGPSVQHLRHGIFPAIKRVCEENGIEGRFHGSMLRMELANGSVIRGMVPQEITRIRGLELDTAWCEEPQYWNHPNITRQDLMLSIAGRVRGSRAGREHGLEPVMLQ